MELRPCLRRRLWHIAEDSDWKRHDRRRRNCCLCSRVAGSRSQQRYGQITRPKIVLRASALFFLMSFSVRKIFFIGESRPKRIFRMARGRGARC
jgi:hypothetical protein